MKKSRRSLVTAGALAAALILAAGLSACSSSSKSSSNAAPGLPTIYIGSLYEPQNLSNISGGGQGINEVFNGNVYEGLFKLDDSGKVENALADSYTLSADRLTYTIKLKSGIKFHSGKTVTSTDVKASIEAVTAKTSQSARKSSFDVVSSIETPDPQTVVVKLSAPSISFIYNLSYIWVINSDKTDISTTEDGTGPYKLDSWVRGSSISLKPFAGYWGAKPKNAGVVFKYFTDASALSNALLSNQIDVITSIQNPDALKQFESNADYTVSNGASTTKELLVFNDRVAPFNKIDVRKAIYSAIDRKKLLESIWGNHGTLIGSMVPPTDPWYLDLVNVNPYDVNLAKSLLAKAGLANGFTFTLDTPTYDPHPVVAEFLKSELAKINVTVKINSISADEWYTKVFQAKNYQATLQEHVNDRDIVWYGDPTFYWGYNNPQVTKWVAEAEAAKTTDQQTALLKLVNKQIAADAASAWLYLYPQIVVAKSNVSGYPINGLNSQFYAYDITKQ
ncbi:MAG TPA: ABC transporter substrate-binding protein [Candidatus Nanopelagicaceae bacterium]|nr:ABC transporter substrate-binding protein [Candidatus Nanopelagicaceae bacterium]